VDEFWKGPGGPRKGRLEVLEWLRKRNRCDKKRCGEWIKKLSVGTGPGVDGSKKGT